MGLRDFIRQRFGGDAPQEPTYGGSHAGFERGIAPGEESPELDEPISRTHGGAAQRRVTVRADQLHELRATLADLTTYVHAEDRAELLRRGEWRPSSPLAQRAERAERLIETMLV